MKIEGQELLQPQSVAKRLRAKLRSLLARKNIFRGAVALSIGATVYWGVIASDRFVSNANILIEHTAGSGAAQVDIGSLLSGNSGSSSRSDQLLLRTYLLSDGMLNKLDAALHLRAHYSDSKRDPLSRLWSASAPQEAFHRYYLSHVSVEFDEYAGVLVVKAQAFEPKMAQAIANMLVREGEKYMNEMGHSIAMAQVSFLEGQVQRTAERFEKARSAMLAYQSEKGTVSPQSEAESGVANISKLEATRVELQTRRNAMLAYLAPTAPAIVDLDSQTRAIEKQIAQEKSLLTAPNSKAKNRTVEEYQRLEMAAMFAQDAYKSALIALEKGRIDATRVLQKVSILQAPTLPEEALEPRRAYNIITFILVTMLIAGIVNLLAAIIRDHKE